MTSTSPDLTPTQATLLLEASVIHLTRVPSLMDHAMLTHAMWKLTHSGHTSDNQNLSPALRAWLRVQPSDRLVRSADRSADRANKS